MNAIVYDTETTGTDPLKDRIIQDAVLSVELNEGFLAPLTAGAVVRHFSSPVPISYGAMAVHRISEFDIADEPPFDSRCIPRTDYLIGHKVDFDWEMLGEPPVKRICTLAIARACYPDESSHSLGAMYLMLSNGSAEAIADLEKAHDAGQDVLLCMRVLRHMIQLHNPSIKTMEDLWKWSQECRVPKKWTFGKFKGKPIDHADRGYMQWYLRQDDQDLYTAMAIRQAMGIR